MLITAFFDKVASKQLSEYLMVAISLGVASMILLVIGMSALNIPLSRVNLLAVFTTFLGLWILWGYFKRWKVGIPENFIKRRDLMENLLLGITFFCLFLLRSVQMSEVFVPNWFDGFVHTSLVQNFIVKEIISIGRIYHVGFHAIALVVTQLSGMEVPQTVLLLGQWFSVICGFTFYSFVRRITHSVFPAFFSLLAYLLLLYFPSHLVSWSRYPFLLGLTFLPPTILTSMDWIDNHQGNYFLTLILVASLIISHYGSFLIWVSYVLVHLVYRIMVGDIKHNVVKGKSILVRSLSLFSPLLVFVSPKVINLLGRQGIIASMVLRGSDPDLGIDTLNVLDLVFDNNSLLVLIWILVSVWLFFKGRHMFSIVLSWPITVLFLTWIQYYLLGISISSYINFIIFLSMPLAIAIGFLFYRASLLIPKLHFSWKPPVASHLIKRSLQVFLVVTIIPGVFTNIKIIVPETIIFTKEDRYAMEWISENTPNDSVFLIRSTFWGNNTILPSDGGGWINLLTGRQIVYPQAIGELYDMCVFARENGANYIYFGKPTGDVLFDLRLSDLDERSYRVVYESPNVKIVYLLC